MTDKSKVTLMPCPFCGGEAELSGSHEYVQCLQCNAEGAYTDSDDRAERAITAWNTRIAMAAPSPDLELLLLCDVALPPATIIRAGCKLSTLIEAITVNGRPKHFEGDPRKGIFGKEGIPTTAPNLDGPVERSASYYEEVWIARNQILRSERNTLRADNERLREALEESVAEQTAIKRVKNALISDMIAEIETLRADNERLRAALKVIAESTPHYLDAWMRASARTALAECKALGDA